LAFDSSGNLDIANFGGSNVLQFNPTTNVMSVLVVAGSNGLPGPTGLAFDSAGHLSIADQAGNQVSELAGGTTAGALTVAANGLSAPTGLAIDAAGNLYIADAGTGPGSISGQVPEADSTGALVQTIIICLGARAERFCCRQLRKGSGREENLPCPIMNRRAAARRP